MTQIKSFSERNVDSARADPAYESLLLFYPLEAGDYTFEGHIGSIATGIRETAITRVVLENMKRQDSLNTNAKHKLSEFGWLDRNLVPNLKCVSSGLMRALLLMRIFGQQSFRC